MFEILIYAVLIVLALIGVGLSLVNLPGVWFVYAGFLLYSFVTAFEVIPVSTLLWFLLVAILSTLSDNIATILGAKKFGSSKWGLLGAMIGGFLGIFTGGPIGMLLGPLLGATAFEMMFAKKERDEALKSGIGAMIGFVASLILKFGVVVWMVIWGIGQVVSNGI